MAVISDPDSQAALLSAPDGLNWVLTGDWLQLLLVVPPPPELPPPLLPPPPPPLPLPEPLPPEGVAVGMTLQVFVKPSEVKTVPVGQSEGRVTLDGIVQLPAVCQVPLHAYFTPLTHLVSPFVPHAPEGGADAGVVSIWQTCPPEIK